MNVLDHKLTAKPEPELARAWAHSLSFAKRQDLAGLVEELLDFLRSELGAQSCAIYVQQPEGPLCLGGLGDAVQLKEWLRIQTAPPQIQRELESGSEVVAYSLEGFCLLAAGPRLSRSGLRQLRLLEPHIQSGLQRLYEVSRNRAKLAGQEQARHQRSAHLAGLSHQLRTPLSVISGFCHILLQQPETSVEKGMLESIRDNGSRLLELVEDVVEMSRLEAGQVRLNPETFSLSTLLEELQAGWKSCSREVSVHIDGSGPFLLGDADALSRLLHQVVATSSRLATTGKIHLCAWFCDEGPLRFEILDEDAHLKAGQLEALFDPFAHPGLHASGGSGLQLAIAQCYATMMGGQIQVEQRTEGLVWTIELHIPLVGGAEALEPVPLQVPTELVPEFFSVPASGDLMELAGAARLGDVDWVDGLLLHLKAELPQHQSFWERCQELARSFHFNALAGMLPLSDQVNPPADSRPAILIVDDNPANLHILYRALSGLECRCLVAQSGDEALRIYRQAQPGVILLDILMPGLDGFETLQRLRDDCKADCPSVIFLSALCHTSDKVKCFPTPSNFRILIPPSRPACWCAKGTWFGRWRTRVPGSPPTSSNGSLNPFNAPVCAPPGESEALVWDWPLSSASWKVTRGRLPWTARWVEAASSHFIYLCKLAKDHLERSAQPAAFHPAGGLLCLGGSQAPRRQSIPY